MSETYGPSNDKIPSAEWRLAELMAKDALRVLTANQRFLKASPARKRVIIATDVLAWLKADKLRPRTGTFLGVAPSFDLMRPAAIQTEKDVVNGDVCQACALGALFACAVERGEAGGTVRLPVTTDSLYRTIAYGREIRRRLAPFFELKQLAMIEAAFERSELSLPVEVRGVLTQSEMDQAFAFTRGWYTEKKKMVAIMTNIIDNGGTFIP